MIARVVIILLVCNLAAWCLGLAQVTVTVCQNKDCCQRFEGKAHNLVQTVKNLVSDPEVVVESSGCLSMCGKGPNVFIRSKGSEERYYGSVVDAASAGAVLELACPDIAIHPTLVAAVNVMERAAKGEWTASFYRVADKNILPFLDWCYLMPIVNVKGFAFLDSRI
jgi:(2Fe-2S) ferredoxin